MNKSTKLFIPIIAGLLLFSTIALLTFWLMVRNTEKKEVVMFHGSSDEIAVVDVKGVIIESEDVVRQLKKFDDDRSVVAIILRVDSPGGSVSASQEIYEEVRKIRESNKIIVVSMGSMAASGGYYVSCGATKIVANAGTLTGSIGVISQFMEYDSLMNKIGITMNTIKSGKMKDVGNPYRKMTPEDKEYFQTLMDNVHHQFIAMVQSERKIDHDTLVKYADGRVFTGEQALHLGLVDTLGSFEDAVNYAADLAGIQGKPSIIKEEKEKERTSLLDLFTGETNASDLIGLKDQILHQPILQYRLPY